MNLKVFKQYDIRGSSITDITPDFAYKLGICFAKMHITKNSNDICIARDGRNSSTNLQKALTQGLKEAGANTIDIDLVPTPLLYYADKIMRPAASIMITASHNPKDDNGFKMIVQGTPFFGQQIQNLYKEMVNLELLNINVNHQFNLDTEYFPISKLCLIDGYIKTIMQDLIFDSNLKIAWDPGNGAASKILTKILNKLPNNNIVINGKIDGNFPGRSPDFNNLQELIKLVQNEQCDFGIAFDGDGDRLCVITKNGEIVEGDKLLCIFAKDILNNNLSRAVIMDIKSSATLFNKIYRYNGHPIISKTGHVHIKEKMHQYNAILGGEISGHFFFADKYYGYDDGTYAALRLIDLLSRNKKNLEELLAELPANYSTPELRIKVSEEKKFCIISQIKNYLYAKNVKFNNLDGVRVETREGWWLIRASNTENVLTTRCEASSSDQLEKIKSEVHDLIARFL